MHSFNDNSLEILFEGKIIHEADRTVPLLWSYPRAVIRRNVTPGQAYAQSKVPTARGSTARRSPPGQPRPHRSIARGQCSWPPNRSARTSPCPRTCPRCGRRNSEGSRPRPVRLVPMSRILGYPYPSTNGLTGDSNSRVADGYQGYRISIQMEPIREGLRAAAT